MSGGRASTGFEVEFSLSLAAVPAWAPIGVDANDYRSHLLGTDDDPPLPETLLHHQERWGHVGDYDDFVDLLRLDRFDPDALASLALHGGADTVITTATSADGWSWWDRADDRCVARRGPRRDVVAEMTTATRARGLAPGVHFEGRRPAPSHLEDVLERYQVEVVSGSWPAELDAQMLDLLAGSRVDLDRRAPAGRGWRTRHQVRDVSERGDGEWLWSVPTGSGYGPNQADPASRRLGPADLIMRYADSSSRSGTLRLVVPLAADGTLDDHDTALLTDVGGWIRRFGPTIRAAASRDDRTDGIILLQGGDGHTFAVVGHDRDVVPGLTADQTRVVRVVEMQQSGEGSDVDFHQDGDGLHVRSQTTNHRARSQRRNGGLPRLLRLEVASPERPVRLFADQERVDAPLTPLLDGRLPGEIVRLGEGPYSGPATVPAGVTLRGLGDRRTKVTAELTLEWGARLEHLHADGVTVAEGADDTLILGCTVGLATVRGDRTTIRASRAAAVEVEDANGITISRCRIAAAGVRSTAISVTGGRDHEFDACTIIDVATAIEIADAEGPTIRGCTIRDVGTGIRLIATERGHVCASRIVGATRSIDVVGGLATLIDGNVIVDADSGVVVRDGAIGGVVSGNYWEGCRTGALLWDVEDVKVADNVIESLGEPEHDVLTGPR